MAAAAGGRGPHRSLAARSWGSVAMMRDTPRTFVGPLVFLLEEPMSDEVAACLREEVERLSGVSSCEVDSIAGTVVVTARSPADRTALVAVLDRLGCRFRA
jgi:hypothetical protein